MAQYSWSTCPSAVKAQVEDFVSATRLTLPDDLTGIYSHGSLAMGCFNPTRSDLDFLVITCRRMTVQEKRRIAVQILRISDQPSGFELSFLSEDQLTPWRYPTPYDFHYSEACRQRIRDELQTGDWQTWNDGEQHDPDLAAHITITRERGFVLFGAPIEEVFPPIPAAHYLDSVLQDWYSVRDHIGANPVYSILNACRVYAYLRDGLITSKQEAGEWALDVLTDPDCAAVENALKIYRGDSGTAFDERALRHFATDMTARIGAFTP
jgi:predicted nucleotidyltransferase